MIMTDKETMSTVKFQDGKSLEPLMTLSKDGLWINPNIPANEVARLVITSLDDSIKLMVSAAVRDEREACAKVCEELYKPYGIGPADAIRARGNK
jgi:hypothetical protein